MNRVWKIIEERKSGVRGMSNYKGIMGTKRSTMSGRKEGSEYEEGVKDGLCAAIDILEEHMKEFDRD